MAGYRRARGVILRMAGARTGATTAGLLLVTVSGLLLVVDRAWESWLTDGLGLVLGATGAALVVMGVGGRRPDWIDDTHEGRGGRRTEIR